AVGATGSLAQWPRRRWPWFSSVAGAACFALSGNPGPLVIGLYTGANRAPRRQVWALFVAGWAGFAAWFWIDEGRLTLSNAVYATILPALVTAAGLYLATREALVTSLRDRAEAAEAQRRLHDERARAAERTRIAREMHDVLAHKVSLIALHAGAMEVTPAGDAEQVRSGAHLIRTTAREAMEELRMVLGVLDAGPERDAPEPFVDLAALVRSATDAGQQVVLDDRAGPLPPATARVVHRVAQEGLTNARKHAPGTPATVSVDRDETGAVTVTVHNGPGTGTPMELPGSGTGLVGLAERIRLVGGSLHSGPTGSGGWQLRAAVPWLP
ncbi:MAG: histidine kinase, partial [Actinocatenispora sp.]